MTLVRNSMKIGTISRICSFKKGKRVDAEDRTVSLGRDEGGRGNALSSGETSGRPRCSSSMTSSGESIFPLMGLGFLSGKKKISFSAPSYANSASAGDKNSPILSMG